jgi:hypothetical protein
MAVIDEPPKLLQVSLALQTSLNILIWFDGWIIVLIIITCFQSED